MPRIHPGQIDVFCSLKSKDGRYERLTAVVDTGAAISLFPAQLLDSAEHSAPDTRRIIIDQAGIANQSFEAIEATVTITLEDSSGNTTKLLTIPAWFANTNRPLLGFAGVLDRSVLHIDMLQQTGWINFDS